MISFVMDRESDTIEQARKAVWKTSPVNYPQLALELRAQREARARRGARCRLTPRSKQKFEYSLVLGAGYYETLTEKEKTSLK